MSSGATLANYSYLSDGTKLGVRRGDVTEGFAYLGSMVYALRADGSLIFESTTIPQGRLRGVSGSGGMSCEPQYFVTDHLGSVRAVVGADGQVAERSDYYPFGGRWSTPDQAISDNRYQFNGKERQVTGGVNWLDYGARMYDDQIGRWLTQDPLSEKYPWLNPYVFCGNNPIVRVDVDGRSWVDAQGRLMWQNGSWTNYATPEAKRIGIAMRATETGLKAFNNVANDAAKIQIEVSSEVKINKEGNLVRGDFTTNSATISDGQVELQEGTITIYEGSIKAETSGKIQTSGETADLIRSLPDDIATEGAVGSVAVHESVHGTRQNTEQRYQNAIAEKQGQPLPHDTEAKPIETQNQHLKQLLMRY